MHPGHQRINKITYSRGLAKWSVAWKPRQTCRVNYWIICQS